MQLHKKIKYCIVGFIDLQGFSSHLEVSNDLRTVIGQQAISRLQTLEDALKIIIGNKKNNSVPFHHKRINDSIIFTIDVDDSLLPNIGDTYKDSLSESDWEKYYNIGKDDIGTFDDKYSEKRKKYTMSVIKFIGLVSRIHQFVNMEERKKNFPGAKTIISTGFRRRFKGFDNKEDFFSANFAFSNAYKAHEILKNGRFFLDNNIIQLLDADLHIRNIAKLACLKNENEIYSPLKDIKQSPKKWAEDDIIKISLFRKDYHFRKANPNPLTYLQFVDDLNDRSDICKSIIENITEADIDEKIKKEAHFKILKLSYDMGKEIYAKRHKK